MIGHDCKNCPSNGNCDIQNTDIKAEEILAFSGAGALHKWVVEAYLISPEETYMRALAALTLVADRENGPAQLREDMLHGAESLPDTVPVLRNFKGLMAVIAQAYSRGVIMAATDTANKVSEALGVPMAVTLIHPTKGEKQQAPEAPQESNPCTLH